MRTRVLPLLLTAGLLVAAHPVEGPGYHHPDEEREIFFSEETAWFTPSGVTGVGNVDHENTEWIGWAEAEPTLPVGGATAAAFYGGFREITEEDGQDKGQFTAEGSFTGYLDSLTMDLYFVGPFQDICELNVAVDLDIDGIPVLDMDGTAGPIHVFAEEAGNGHVARLKVTNIFGLLDGYDLAGEVDQVHTVHLSVQQFPLCNEVVWLYGGTEAPARIIFNRDPSDPSVAVYTTYDAQNPPVTPAA